MSDSAPAPPRRGTISHLFHSSGLGSPFGSIRKQSSSTQRKNSETMKRRASKELVQRVNEVFNRLRNETDVYDDDDAGAPDQSSFITRVLETVGLKPKLAVNKVEDKVEAKYNNKYSLLLNFYKADDAAQFHAFMKNKVYPPIFWFFFVLVGGIDMSRISLTQMFKEGPWLKVTGAISVAAIVAFFIFAVSTFSRITYNVFGEDMWLERVCRAVATGFFRGYIEDVITVLFALALSSYLVARVVQGQCSDDGSARAYIDCNPLAEDLSPPIDSVIAVYVHPLVLQNAIKGISKQAMLFSWALGTAAVLWSVIYYRGWFGIYAILDSLFFFLVMYETHRLKMLSFLQTKYELNIEKKRREKAETEMVLRNELLEEELRKKRALEAEDEKRAQRLQELPIHSGIRKLQLMDNMPKPNRDAYVRELLHTIRNNLGTVKERDYDGRMAFSLLLDMPNADIACINELLVHSLPIDPETEELVPPEEHDYAWHRIVQYERYEPCVNHVLASFPAIGPELAIIPDAEGRQAVHIASPKCKKAILGCIYFFRRYEIITLTQPHYQTKTSLVHLAIDHDSEDTNKMVALKFMRDRHHFMREVQVRTLGGFDDEFVLGMLRVHDSDEDPTFREETISKGIEFFPYCLVMPVGERNLTDIMVKEHIAGRDWAEIKVMMTQIGQAVAHMHDNGFIHGDLKPLNIMRVAAKMKLIDLDSACEYKSGTSYAGAKFSSGFLPPEMVYVGDTTACVRSESLLRGGDDDDDDEEDGMGRTRHGGVGSSDGLDKFAASDRGEEKYVDPGSRPLYDVILCDSVMPNMDGPTAVRIIRELGYDGPILGVTGNTLPEQIENFVRHGADEVMSKPVKVPVLQDALSRRSGKDGVPLSARLTHSAKDGEASSAAPGGGSGGGGGGGGGSGGDTGTATKPLHVLVVEDAPVARTMLVRLLKTMNCTIDEAEDGQQAVDKVRISLGRGSKLSRRKLLFDLVPAKPAIDLWSLGVVFYQIACNVPLFLCDGEGNVGDADLRVLAEWSDDVKAEKLSRVKNPLARNLLSIMLQKDPHRRPAVATVLKHPFLSFHRAKPTVVVGGETMTPEFDVFISYRVATDLPHVELLHKLLQNAGMKVWWDKTSLEPGVPWDIAAFKGMLKSKIFIPLVSRGALQRMSTLAADSACDNMYLEFVLALELRERGTLDKVFPLMLGDKDDATGKYARFTFRGSNPCYPTSWPETVVTSVDAKLRERLDDMELGMPLVDTMTVSEVLAGVMKYQGAYIEGDLEEALKGIINNKIAYMHLQDVASTKDTSRRAESDARSPLVSPRLSPRRRDGKSPRLTGAKENGRKLTMVRSQDVQKEAARSVVGEHAGGLSKLERRSSLTRGMGDGSSNSTGSSGVAERLRRADSIASGGNPASLGIHPGPFGRRGSNLGGGGVGAQLQRMSSVSGPGGPGGPGGGGMMMPGRAPSAMALQRSPSFNENAHRLSSHLGVTPEQAAQLALTAAESAKRAALGIDSDSDSGSNSDDDDQKGARKKPQAPASDAPSMLGTLGRRLSNVMGMNLGGGAKTAVDASAAGGGPGPTRHPDSGKGGSLRIAGTPRVADLQRHNSLVASLANLFGGSGSGSGSGEAGRSGRSGDNNGNSSPSPGNTLRTVRGASSIRHQATSVAQVHSIRLG